MPGHSIAAVRELKSSLWATAGGKGAEIRPNPTLAGRPGSIWVINEYGLIGVTPGYDAPSFPRFILKGGHDGFFAENADLEYGASASASAATF